jgi:eukaryotic-like serine/threonine-protein kinase
MPLEPGARLGPYEIISPAGAGGMGEVWKARDTRLDRTVAIKVLPPDLTADPAARQRFEREARAVAALSHPHICTLHDIGQQDGTDYLVMEYLDGETLAQRLARGRLPVDQALQYGLQIADALAAAHRAGIVHRDLKPGNVMLTKSGAKLLDFGLAKPSAQIAGLGVTQLATQGPLTGAGTLLGTLQYMAPEQLQGATADARADVFAFGCVLYEMLTGRRAFGGDTPASVIAAILDHEPAPFAGTSDQVAHPVLDAVIRTCLAKNPEERWSSGHDLWLALRRLGHVREAPTSIAPSRPRLARPAIPWVIAVLSLATAGAAFYRLSSRSPALSAAPAVQSFIEFPSAYLANPMISPDGRYLALTVFGGGQILVRRLADGHTSWLAGTERGLPLTWSPDARSLAFIGEGAIKDVDIATGAIRTIAKVPKDLGQTLSGALSGAWSGDNVLIGGPHLRRISIADGQIRDVYPADAEVSSQDLPSFLPDGRTFLYSQESRNPVRRGVFLGTLGSSVVTRVLTEPTLAVCSPRGYLFYGQRSTLFAQRFDLERRRLTGDPVSIVSGLTLTGFALGGDTLVWDEGAIFPPSRLVWFDRRGQKLNELGDVRRYIGIALAPDGQRVATTEIDSQGWGLFVIELSRSIHARLAPQDQGETDPVWSPNSRDIAFNCPEGLCKRSIDQGARTTLWAAPVTGVEEWTHDGRFVLFGLTPQSVSALPLSGDRKPIPIIESSSMVDEPHVSRDGRWLAYSSNDTGQWEVYLQPFMRPGGRMRVSINGGSQSRWRADGRELFYITLDGTIMSVEMTEPARPSAPRKLFDSGLAVTPVTDQYDVTADGQRFLLMVPQRQQGTRLTVLTNWPAVLAGR